MTRFSQLLNHFPKNAFKKIIANEKADRYLKSFKTWDLLHILLYGQITQTKSLRRVISGFNTHTNSHYHMNTSKVKRSTFSEALSKRSIEPFKQICEVLMGQFSSKHKKKCKDFISIIDSTPITLKSRGYEWALKNRTIRSVGLKIHVELNSADDAPMYSNITHPNVNDIVDARTNIEIQKGTTYVVDKGYTDYNWWHKINESKAFFVTRAKVNIAMKVVKETDVEKKDEAIIQSDQIIHLTNHSPGGGRKNKYANKDLRMVTIYREDKKPMKILTNDFDRSAIEIANLYKQRWQIELFFKWIKQKLKLKTYFGQSENAIRIQIYTALISYLLMKLMQKASKGWSKLIDLQTWLQHGLFIKDSINTDYYRRRREKQMLIDKLQTTLEFA
ncbi:MAG: IS4 family transposase [Gammaproteobacteria bacterium]|jgi:IS4 transposase|nr:IS4 family transposase [Xanthomonadales bacterium]